MAEQKIIHELIRLLEGADATTIDALKPELLKYAKLSALSLGNDEKTLEDETIHQLYSMWSIPFTNAFASFTEDLQNDIFKLNRAFTGVYESFVDGMYARGYLGDSIELSTHVLRSLNGKVRWIKHQTPISNQPMDYFHSEAYFEVLKAEIRQQLHQETCESMYHGLFVITGLVYLVKDYLDEESRTLAGAIRNLIELSDRSVEEIKNDPLTRKYFDPQYPKELRRRIYLWDSKSVELRNEYSLEVLMETEE